MHLSDDELVLHYYGEMDAPEESRAAGHLSSCERCQASYAKLQRVLAAIEAVPAPDLGAGFEQVVWARLEPNLHRHRPGWLAWFVFSPARLGWMTAIGLLVAGAFFAGRGWKAPAPAATAASTSHGDLRERLLLLDLGEHLDRSQMMLVELVSAGGDGAIDMSAERARAEQLVSSNRLYRQTAVATGNRALADLLDELERVLIDVAASPERVSPADMDDVRQRIESKDLLFKVRVLSTEVRERQKAKARTRTGQSS